MNERVVADLYRENVGVILPLLQTGNEKAAHSCIIYDSSDISRDHSVHVICEYYALRVTATDINDPR